MIQHTAAAQLCQHRTLLLHSCKQNKAATYSEIRAACRLHSQKLCNWSMMPHLLLSHRCLLLLLLLTHCCLIWGRTTQGLPVGDHGQQRDEGLGFRGPGSCPQLQVVWKVALLVPVEDVGARKGALLLPRGIFVGVHVCIRRGKLLCGFLCGTPCTVLFKMNSVVLKQAAECICMACELQFVTQAAVKQCSCPRKVALQENAEQVLLLRNLQVYTGEA